MSPPRRTPTHPVPTRPRRPLARIMLTGLGAGVLLAAVLTAAPAAAAAAAVERGAGQSGTAVAEIHTARTASGGYEVYVGGVRRTTVTVSDPGFSVRTALSPDGERAAVITDFDGRAGAQLLLLDVRSGDTTRIATGRITSAVFAPDGRLGFVSAAADRAQLFTLDAAGAQPVAVGRVDAADTELLGWAAADAALVVTRPAGELSAPSLSRVDLATGTSRSVLVSDPAHGLVYRDLRVTRIGGAVRITGIRADHVYPCAGTASSLFLADERGAVLRSTAATPDAYREAVWSADGGRVAYAIQGCVSVADKITSKAGALARLTALNGVYVQDLGTGRTHRAVPGLTANFRLDSVTGTALRFSSERFGVRTVDVNRADAAGVAQLDAGTSDIGIESKIVPSTFIHQLWDTADNFNGNSACGPTSSVMDLAGYQLASENGYWVSYPSSHWSPYGGYITNAYSAYGTTFNRYGPDPNWNYFAGAYGWMVTDPNIGSWYNYLRDYLDRQVSYAIAETGTVTWSWVKSKIDANLMVVVSGDFVYGRYGHIALITGYLDDGRVYVNDPYGAGTDGSWDGKNTVYTFDYMRAKYGWAA